MPKITPQGLSIADFGITIDNISNSGNKNLVKYTTVGTVFEKVEPVTVVFGWSGDQNGDYSGVTVTFSDGSTHKFDEPMTNTGTDGGSFVFVPTCENVVKIETRQSDQSYGDCVFYTLE